mmetsp:Transcript_26179/g.86102  ORF Transcript_26179/g.86102 Transcript_26179/m.86102 type:complete len:266 (-) Transcript_26179:960-1757(-)
MPDLLLEHLPHVVRSSPHPLPDLSFPWKFRQHAAVYVPVLVGLEPGLLLQLCLGVEGTSAKARMNLVPCTVKKPGIDEDNPLLCCSDRLVEVDGHSPLLIHHPHLQRVPPQTQEVLRCVEELVHKLHLLRPVHLGPHDVHTPRPRVLRLSAASEVMQGSQAGDGQVEHVLRNLTPVLERHSIRVQVHPDVSHEEYSSPRQPQLLSSWSRPDPVGVHSPGDHSRALLHLNTQASLHQPRPCPVHLHLVLRVHGRHRVLAVRDGGQG